MRERYGLPVGLSDHSLANYPSFAAVTFGAEVVEKHFTLSRNLYGSDAKHSLEPDDLKDLVEGIRAIETMLATDVDKDDISRFTEMKEVFQKSIVSTVDIPEGTVITRKMVGIKKPGSGIAPKYLERVVGKRAARSIPGDSVLKFQDIERQA
jgi:N-acetylneuraminate synthase